MEQTEMERNGSADLKDLLQSLLDSYVAAPQQPDMAVESTRKGIQNRLTNAVAGIGTQSLELVGQKLAILSRRLRQDLMDPDGDLITNVLVSSIQNDIQEIIHARSSTSQANTATPDFHAPLLGSGDEQQFGHDRFLELAHADYRTAKERQKRLASSPLGQEAELQRHHADRDVSEKLDAFLATRAKSPFGFRLKLRLVFTDENFALRSVRQSKDVSVRVLLSLLLDMESIAENGLPGVRMSTSVGPKPTAPEP